MIRLCAMIFSLLTFQLASAQLTTSGNFVIGSSFGFSSASSNIIQEAMSGTDEGEGPSSLQLSISPKIGYFIQDEFAVGIGLDYTLSEVREPNEDRRTDSDLLFGPFARYYLPVGEDAAIFLEANFGFGNSTDNLNIGGETRNISTNIFATGFGPGLTVFSNESFGVSAILKYNFARSKFDIEIDGIAQETITRTNQFDFSVGVAFYFATSPAGTTRANPGMY